MNDHCWITKWNWLLDFFPLLPPKKASFPLSDPHLLCPSHPAERPQTDNFFQLEKQVKKHQYQERQRFRRRLQRWVIREVLNPLGKRFISFPALKKPPSCPPTCLCQCLAKMMIYQLLSNLELSVSWGQRPSAQYDNKVLHLTAKSLDAAAFQHSRLENVLQLCINWRGGIKKKGGET